MNSRLMGATHACAFTTRLCRLRVTLMSVAVATLFTGSPLAQAVSVTWLGGTGNWTDANWSLGGFPNADTADIFIDGGNPVNSSVNLNTNVTIGDLDIGNGDALTILNGRSMSLAGSITNNGTLTLNSLGSYTDLRLTGDATLTGSGTTMLGNTIANRMLSDGTLRTLTIGAGHTVQGSGNLGFNGNELQFINQGTVVADGSVGLRIWTTGSGFDNSAGLIQVMDGSNLAVGSGDLSGGTIQGFGTGGLQSFGSGTYRDVTLSGDLRILNSDQMNIAGTITNNGTLTLNSLGSYTDLRLTGDATLTGSGTTMLSNTIANRILSDGT